MKSRNIVLVSVLLSVLGFSSCSKEEEVITPSELSNINTESLEGQIKITWENVSPANFEYVKITYYDKLKKKKMQRLASKHTSEIIIPNTRKKYGTYVFTLQPFSSTKTGGKEYTIEGVSGPAPSTIASTIETKQELVASNLFSNEPEQSEGSLANLLDDNVATFFHSRWSGGGGNTPHTHYLQVNLETPIKDGIKFFYAGRNNGNNYPTKIVVSGSMDGTNWEEISAISEGLPNPSGAVGKYTSGILWFIGKQYKHFKFDVTKTEDGRKFFVMSEFKLWQVKPIIEDPEAPAIGD
ncbi:discoidin domain-containing protein [Capnocytophaga canimorsus]|uniref:discoidin domain-containing protein n=1 Tax=Capnocytophaga canimorsus TaxID=28188 RepID=UPI000BB188D2|nr:discoidin domain-containing protein [Capnocytophaga canimorsus]ATA76883.1 carbohydrate-binding protein [Capnocytophaga canimorsus]PJI83987.1 F5/8 type C domain-containing protein [Capnocytophaga canimorsus]STA72087.1 F5/8 type C domain [Capnocytophaga canimorsus]